MIPKTLESPFVLWLLSAVFISFGTWAYTLWDTKHKEDAALIQRIERLDDEIQYRFTRAGLFVEFRMLDPRQASPVLSEDHQAGVEAFVGRVMRAPLKDATLFPEYAERGLLSLTKELELALVKAADSDAKAKVLQRSSVVCVSQAIALLTPLDDADRPPAYAIQTIRAIALMASAYRWGFRGAMPWSTALKQNQVAKEDVERILAGGRKQTADAVCDSPTLIAMTRDAMALQPVGQSIP